jgi:ParB family chromosome partitioning protein
MAKAMLQNRSLGRGLSTLLPSQPVDVDNHNGFEYISIDLISPNPHQPRKTISLESVLELSESIKEKGVMTPLVVVRSKEVDGGFMLVAGERRLRASKLAGLDKVPALIRDLTDQDMAEMAIIENIHRKELNPIEEGYAFLKLHVEFGLTSEEIGHKISKTKAYVENKIRLTKLPRIIQNAISIGEITENHGRILFGLGEEGAMIAALKIVIRNKLSAEKTEELVRQIKIETLKEKKSLHSNPTLEWEQKYGYIKDDLLNDLGWNVKLKRNKKNGGSLTINFNDDKQLVSIYRKISGKDDSQ